MSERIGNNELKTLDTLPNATFHLLSYEEQLVVLQNTTLELSGGFGVFKPLTVEEIRREEVEALHLLISDRRYIGPFASTFYEGKYAWESYVTPDSKEVTEAFKMTEIHNLWGKYFGLADYNPELMGQVNHSLNLVCEGYLGKGGFRDMASPSRLAPSYAKVLERDGYFEDALVLGAFSIKSVADIWAIKKHLLKGDPHLEIIDLNNMLNGKAAKHYGIPFLEKDALDTGFLSGSKDLVMTNFLTTSLESSEPLTLKGLIKARERLFKEIGRITDMGGRLLMVETPLSAWSEEEEVYDKDGLKAEYVMVKQQLTANGFGDIQIENASIFTTRNVADEFVTGGKIDYSKVTDLHWSNPLLISAKKK